MTIKNPCIDSNFVTIQAPTLTNETYIIDSGEDIFGAHSSFNVVTTPVGGLSLCGTLSFVAKFDGKPADGDPLSYNVAA